MRWAFYFGIKLPNGTVWPVLPLPVVRFSTKAQWLKFSADFQKSITIGYTILPESKVRLTGSSVMEPFDIRSARDISFDNTLWYRFFSKESKMGDFAGVG
ncbi:MAG: hypothetical protein LBU89_13175, partial [Fibromonadaceae bacterium]|nr:hypothetical protein [Fibromonadaceae bacterium]